MHHRGEISSVSPSGGIGRSSITDVPWTTKAGRYGGQNKRRWRLLPSPDVHVSVSAFFFFSRLGSSDASTTGFVSFSYVKLISMKWQPVCWTESTHLYSENIAKKKAPTTATKRELMRISNIVQRPRGYGQVLGHIAVYRALEGVWHVVCGQIYWRCDDV